MMLPNILNLPTSQAFQLWETAINSTKNGVTIADAQQEDQPLIYANPAFYQLTGYSSDEVLGRNCRFLQGREVNQPGLRELRKALAEHKFCNVVIKNFRKDGSIFWNELFISPIFDTNGKLTHFIGIQNDITARKVAETEVLELNHELEQRVKERTVQLEAEIDRRMLLESELRNALEKEQELGKLRSRFISMTSHEFRTPLSIILSNTELLEHNGSKWTEERRIQCLHSIQESVAHMTNMLEEILTVNRSEAGVLEFNPKPSNLSVICKDILSEVSQTLGAGSPILFVNNFEPELVLVDEKHLKLILLNLLSNAIKYSKHGNPVSFTLSNLNNSIVLEVKDSGIGIPTEDYTHIFELFHRAANVLTIPGTGLGLALAKKSVELHGGEISFSSKLGEGSTFTVILPLKLPGGKL